MMEQFRRLQASLSTSNPAIGQWLETATSYAETIHDGSEYAKSTTDEVPLVEDPTYAPQQIDIPPMAVQEIEALKESVQSVQKTITQSIQDLNKMSQSSQPAPTPFLSKDQVLSLMEKQFRWRQERTSIWPTYITPMNSGTSTNDWSKIIFADAGRNILKADGSVPGPLWNLSPKESKLSTYIYFHVISLLYLEAKMRERDNRFEWSFAGLTKHTDTRALTNSCYAVIYMRRSLKQDVTCDEKFMNEDTRHMRWQIPQKDEKTGKDLAVLKIDPQVKLACTVMPKQVLLAVQRQGLERRWDNDRSVKLKM